jgi:hypothetical protein
VANAHSYKPGKAGKESAGDKGKGDEPGEKMETGHYAQNDKHTGEKDGDGSVLASEKRGSPGADGAGDFLHQLIAFRESEYFFALQERKDKRYDTRCKAYPVEIFHGERSLLNDVLCKEIKIPHHYTF